MAYTTPTGNWNREPAYDTFANDTYDGHVIELVISTKPETTEADLMIITPGVSCIRGTFPKAKAFQIYNNASVFTKEELITTYFNQETK